jgi:hypothetical protein
MMQGTSAASIASLVATMAARGPTAVSTVSVVSNTLITDAQLATLLLNITSSTGTILVQNCNQLTRIALPSLTSVGDSLRILGNRGMLSVAIPALVSVTRDLQFNGCGGCQMHRLQDLNAGSLVTVGGRFWLYYMASLTDVGDSFPALRTTGYMYIRTVSFIVRWGTSGTRTPLARLPISFPSLVSIGGLSMIMNEGSSSSISMPLLTTVSGNFYIGSGGSVGSIRMPSLATMTGRLRITSMGTLSSLCDFGLTQAGYTSTTAPSITRCPHLSTVPSWLTATVGQSATVCSGNAHITIASQADYTAFTVARPPGTRMGDVVISWPAITDSQLANVLSAHTQVDGLTISGCTALTTISSSVLGSLQSVAGSLVFEQLSAVTSISVPALSSVGGAVRVASCTNLAQVNMTNLTTVGASVQVSRNTRITSIHMGVLTTVSGAFEILYSNGCRVLNARALRTVGGAFNLQYLANLANTSALFPVLRTVGGSLTLRTISYSTRWGLSGTRAPLGRIPISFPQLVSTGSIAMTMNEITSTGISFPQLVNITGGFYLGSSRAVITVELPRLERLTGLLRIQSMSTLADLCLFGNHVFALTGAGYTGPTAQIRSSSALVRVPGWLATQASLTSTTACTSAPTQRPTTPMPTQAPTVRPTAAPTAAPTVNPTVHPCTNGQHNCDQQTTTCRPTTSNQFACDCNQGYYRFAGCALCSSLMCVLTPAPTVAPTARPTQSPTAWPTLSPIAEPTFNPVAAPTTAPTSLPSASPSSAPTGMPTTAPSAAPTGVPTTAPSTTAPSPGAAASSGSSGGSGNGQLIPIIILVVVIVIVVVVAAVYLRNRNSSTVADSGRATAFTNDLYDDSNSMKTVPANADGLYDNQGDEGGYMDVPIDGAYADTDTFNDGDFGDNDIGGYMDVEVNDE